MNLPKPVAILGVTLLASTTTLRAGVFDNLPDIQPRVETYKTVGARSLKLYIYLPPSNSMGRAVSPLTAADPERSDARRPAILFIHGGGWGAGKPDFFFPHCRYFAARGVVAMTVQYRLTQEPGVTVFNCVADVKSCVRWIRRHADELGVATNRIAVAGDSAGGHLAACLGLIRELDEPGEDTSVSAMADAMILYNPVIKTTLPDGWDMVRFGGKAGAAVADRAREFSPADHVAAGAPPTLVIHGTADTVTPLAWSERFVKAMEEAGNSIQFMRFEGRKHAFVIPFCSDDETVRLAVERTWQFLVDLRWVPAR